MATKQAQSVVVAPTPPLGWRSWNLLGPNVNQSILETIMLGMTKPKIDGMALCADLGYCNVGLDDAWQACNDTAAVQAGMHYHDVEGKSVVNTTRFPDLKAMTDKAHELGLTVGWYHNNCICSDYCKDDAECDAQIEQDARAVVDLGFDAVKLDGCGGQTNLTAWDFYLQKYHQNADNDRPIEVENCHWGRTVPNTPEEYCPYAFYRTSGDIRPNYQSVMHNLATVDHFHKHNLSRPGCWAYPDMLQVGVHLDYTGTTGLNRAETRSHFGAWAIVSSPLILSHDVNNDTLTAEIWDLIANREVLAVNQAYVGDSGGVFYSARQTAKLPDIEGWQAFPGEPNPPKSSPVKVPSHQFLAKQLEYDSSRVAVLILNSKDRAAQLSLKFKDVPGISCTNGCSVRDIWQHEKVGVFKTKWSVTVEPHDAAFIILESMPAGTVVAPETTTMTFAAMLQVAVGFLAASFIALLAIRAKRGRKQTISNKNQSIQAQCVAEMEVLMKPRSKAHDY